MAAYYNEIDPYAARWLRNLIAAGHLPPGDVDQRSILEVEPGDLAGYDECHFFAGIGGWPYALRLAGWFGPVWTGSCPCQPLSSAGQRKGHADERHLWPAFQCLIAECRPAAVFGEQVASKDGREWLAGVRADLEALGYAVGAADLCAASVGSPHIRQRLFWVADAQVQQRQRRDRLIRGTVEGSAAPFFKQFARSDGATGGLADAGSAFGIGWEDEQRPAVTDATKWNQETINDQRGGATGGLGDAEATRQPIGIRLAKMDGSPSRKGSEQTGFWLDAEWLLCLDGKARRVKPGIQPLAHGIPNRVGKLRAAGNTIVPQVAAEFVKAVMDD